MNQQDHNTAMLLLIIEDYDTALKTLPVDIEDYEIIAQSISDKAQFLRNLYNHVTG